MFVHDFIRNHLLENAGVFEVKKMPDLSKLHETEWSFEFETLMRNRLYMGAFRYGNLNQKGKVNYNRIKSMKDRIALYEKTGNGEYLVDIANYSLLEFNSPNHKAYHFKAIDEHNYHTEIIKD